MGIEMTYGKLRAIVFRLLIIYTSCVLINAIFRSKETDSNRKDGILNVRGTWRV